MMTVAVSQFDTVLIIGAGEGDDLQDWLATDAKRIILVEPNPACTPALKRASASSDRVEHVEAAVAAQDGEAQLRVFNLSRHSSLRKPSTLVDLLPGLRQVASLPVATLSAASLMQRVGVDPGSLLLVLDAPGAEFEILQSFKDAGALDTLYALDLICSEEPQYQGSVGRPDLQMWIEEAGFSLVTTDASDPDWPRLSFRIDHKARRIAALAAELAEMFDARKSGEDQIRALHDQLADVEAAASTSAAESAKEIADLQQQLLATQQAQDRLAMELAQSQEARQATEEVLGAQIRDHAQTAAAQSAQYSRLEADRNALARQLEDATAHSNDLTAQLDDLGKAVSQHLADLDMQSSATMAAQTIADGLAARVAELDLTVAGLAQQLQATGIREQDALQDAAEIRANLELAAASQASLEQERQNLADQIAAKDATIADLKEKVVQGAKELAETESLSAIRHQRMKDLEAEVKSKVTALAEVGARLEQTALDLESARASLTDMSQEVAAGSQRIGVLERELVVASEGLESREMRLAELESEVTDLRDRLEASTRQIGERDTELAETRNMLATRTAEKAAAEERIGVQAKQAAALESAVQTAQADAAAKGESLAKQVAWTGEIKYALDQARIENAARVARIAELESRIEDQKSGIASLETRAAELDAILAVERTEYARQSDDLAIATRQINELRERQSELESGLSRATSDLAQFAERAASQADRIKELEFRRDLARDELRRSEGQLTLIKELLLRGDRL